MDEARRLENHWLACMASVGGDARVTRVPGARVVANLRFEGMAFNFIALRDVQPDGLRGTLERGAALLAGYGRPAAAYLTPAAGDVAALSGILAGLGWQLRTRQVALARDLPATGLDASPEVVVREITLRERSDWARTLTTASAAPRGTIRLLRAAWSSLHRHPGEGATTRCCLAWLDGCPVGTGLTWSAGGLAGLYCGAVLPQWRRRGVERATVVYRLRQAAADGAVLAHLQTEAGSPVAHLCQDRLGFRLVYNRELWAAPAIL